MARLPRIVVPGQAQHVIHRGNNRQPIFFADEDYHKYRESLHESAGVYGCAVHAYVLMTNHIHLLVTPERRESLSLMMQGIGRKFVRYINCVYRRTGTLWEGRFKSALIDSEQYLLTCSRYIEMNPVRASMVEGPGEYRWSSYRANALGHNDKCVTPHYLYTQLGHNPEACRQAYLALFRTHVDDEVLSLIRRQTEQCTVIGDTRFQAEIQAMLKRRVIKQQHGGDRKSEAFVKTSSVLTP